jgi:hypothetical protein
MLDPRTEQIARPAHDSMNGVALFQKQLGQIRAVLSGDPGDQGGLVSHGLIKAESGKTETLKIELVNESGTKRNRKAEH